MRLVGGIVLLTWRARLQYLEEWSQHLGLSRARRPNGRIPAHTFAGAYSLTLFIPYFRIRVRPRTCGGRRDTVCVYSCTRPGDRCDSVSY